VHGAMVCAGLSKILLILERLRRFLPGPKLDSVENALERVGPVAR
jgi:hypothetical protein